MTNLVGFFTNTSRVCVNVFTCYGCMCRDHVFRVRAYVCVLVSAEVVYVSVCVWLMGVCVRGFTCLAGFSASSSSSNSNPDDFWLADRSSITSRGLSTSSPGYTEVTTTVVIFQEFQKNEMRARGLVNGGFAQSPKWLSWPSKRQKRGKRDRNKGNLPELGTSPSIRSSTVPPDTELLSRLTPISGAGSADDESCWEEDQNVCHHLLARVQPIKSFTTHCAFNLTA